MVRRAAGRMNVALSADPLPGEGLFTRSDHYRFVQEGVPSVFLMTGFANGGEQAFTDFLKTHYHKPSDDLKLPIDWKAGARFAQINYLIAREVADAPERPRWYEDSFFGQTVAAGQEKAKRPR
jgi:Zn-dependent M28 family amino/carboxypeptidase